MSQIIAGCGCETLPANVALAFNFVAMFRNRDEFSDAERVTYDACLETVRLFATGEHTYRAPLPEYEPQTWEQVQQVYPPQVWPAPLPAYPPPHGGYTS